MNETDIRFDLNVLKVYEALYEEGSATRAALRLGVTQSAVSAALRRLRTLYGDPLFTRTGRGLAPTLRAQELKPLISEAMNRCRESLAMGGRSGVCYQGRSVTVGLSDDFEIAAGRQLIETIARRAPGLRLAFRQTHSHVVAEMLIAREIDLSIASGGFAAPWLSRELLGEGSYACLVDPASTESRRWRLNVDEYLRRGHILISSGGFIGVVDEVLAANNRKRRVIASTTHFAALPHLLKGSDSVATMPLHAAQAIAALSGLRLMPCPVPMPRYPIELGWRADTLRDPAVADVKTIVAEVLSNARWT